LDRDHLIEKQEKQNQDGTKKEFEFELTDPSWTGINPWGEGSTSSANAERARRSSQTRNSCVATRS